MLCDDKFWQLMCAEKYLIMDSNDNLDSTLSSLKSSLLSLTLSPPFSSF